MFSLWFSRRLGRVSEVLGMFALAGCRAVAVCATKRETLRVFFSPLLTPNASPSASGPSSSENLNTNECIVRSVFQARRMTVCEKYVPARLFLERAAESRGR
jgi:hypothetical protein